MPNLVTMSDPSALRRHALSSWDNEGGAVGEEVHTDVPEMTNSELVHLRVRVIALENLLIAVLAESSNQQRHAVRDMAALISPRPRSTQHPLTIRAAQHMTDLLDRAAHIREVQTECRML
ncbi:hypothetical protein [Paracoccus sp. (in: a-proteobacteria)]|uniref:hypothetical protein n=1 Tax=Paracoccus sp. TaxID=267 RepID=UPI00396C445A